jgi:hypothetical protein
MASITDPKTGKKILVGNNKAYNAYTASTQSAPSSASSQLKALSIANSPKPATSSAIDYTLHPGESVSAYNTRIASARSNPASTPTSIPQSTGIQDPGRSSLRDLSIALANGNKVSQSQVNSGSLPNTGTAENPNVANIPNYEALVAARNAASAPRSYTPASAPSNADSYYKSLISSLSPTSAENALQDQQTALDSTLRNLNQGQGVMDANIEDQPIALPFIVGQQKAVEQRYALQRGDIQNQQQTTQQKLANLQARRQSAIDISKAGLDYANQQDSRNAAASQQAIQNAFAERQFAAQQAQQQYTNQTNATQQALENAIAQQKAASGGGSTKISTQIIEANGKKLLVNTQTGAVISDLGSALGTTDEESKQIQKFTEDAAKYIEKLGSNTISWGTAFNALKAQYPKASNELIDQTLGKEKYYTVNP